MRWIAAAVGLILVGLTVHWYGAFLGPDAQDILGDALWAAMMYCWVGALTPRENLRVRALVTLSICMTVEVSQLRHTPLLDRLRATTLGHLVLGSDFDVRDLLSYATGIAAAHIIDWRMDRRKDRLMARG